MAVAHATNIRNAMADLVVDLVDVGTTNAGGALVLLEGTFEIARIQFGDPAFGDAASGEASANGLPLSTTASASTTGGVDILKIVDRSGAEVLTGSVTTTSGGGDLEMDNTDVNSGQTVELDQMTYVSAP